MNLQAAGIPKVSLDRALSTKKLATHVSWSRSLAHMKVVPDAMYTRVSVPASVPASARFSLETQARDPVVTPVIPFFTCVVTIDV
jgi:hypothetical protein